MPEVVYIVPPGMAPEGRVSRHETPYGAVTDRGGALIRDQAADPRALIYAAKQAGACAVLAAATADPISPLLEPGDLVVPADVVDLTRLLPSTFFVGKGYGFIKVDPPFCPELMAALYEAARAATPRAFRGATLVGTDGQREATPAERRMYRTWGADLVGSGLVPEAFLARELELCYAALVVVDARPPADGLHAGLLPVLVRATELARSPRSCACGRAMAGARAQGVIGDDWREWTDRHI
ncbi:phosphorylase family protein [Symbiobacterium terraclitae]|uniref:phosphorylase family protein n=1 Tax=Symbiobacterium terraclitae TaxID=557451 RepID=UPI0035B50A7A